MRILLVSLALLVQIACTLPGNVLMPGSEISVRNIRAYETDPINHARASSYHIEGSTFDIFYPISSKNRRKKQLYKVFVNNYLSDNILRYDQIRSLPYKNLLRFLENPYVLANKQFMEKFDDWLEEDMNRYRHGDETETIVFGTRCIPNYVVLKFFHMKRKRLTPRKLYLIWEPSHPLSSEQMRVVIYGLSKFPSVEIFDVNVPFSEELIDDLVEGITRLRTLKRINLHNFYGPFTDEQKKYIIGNFYALAPSLTVEFRQ